MSCRAARSQLFVGENDDGLAEDCWCNLSYRFGAGCAAYEEKPFWPSSVEHQSFEILSEAAEYALHGGAGDMSGRRIGLCQPVDNAASTQLR